MEFSTWRCTATNAMIISVPDIQPYEDIPFTHIANKVYNLHSSPNAPPKMPLHNPRSRSHHNRVQSLHRVSAPYPTSTMSSILHPSTPIIASGCDLAFYFFEIHGCSRLVGREDGSGI